MRLPRFTYDVPLYKQLIISKLREPDCHIFLDTSVVLQLYELKPPALADFFSWVTDSNTITGTNRIHIPKWAAFEISNTLITRSKFIEEKANILSNCAIKLKTAADLLRYGAEDGLFKNLKPKSKSPQGWQDNASQAPAWYTSRETMLDGLNHVAEVMELAKNVFNNGIGRRKSLLDEEISAKLEPLFLPHDVFKIIKKYVPLGQMRYECRLPPGFKDQGKEFNCYGDLIIWQEVLKFCRKLVKKLGDRRLNSESQDTSADDQNGNSTLSAVLISSDEKADLTYKPDKPVGGRRENDAQIRLTRPELQEEFFHATGSEEFHVISLDLLIEYLIAQDAQRSDTGQGKSERYSALIDAFQNSLTKERAAPDSVDTDNADDSSHESDDAATALTESKRSFLVNIEDPHGQPVFVNRSERKAGAEGGDGVVKGDSAEFDRYEKQAYIDSSYTGSRGTDRRVLQCIAQFKSYNWYEQNRGVDALHTLSRTPPENSLENRSALFVVGRNLVQSAQGNAYSAISLLVFLNELTLDWPSWMVSAVIDGCFYEEFFDSHGELRKGAFKAIHHEELLNSAREIGRSYRNRRDGGEALSDPLSFICAVLRYQRANHPNCRFLPNLADDQEQYAFTLEPASDDSIATGNAKGNDAQSERHKSAEAGSLPKGRTTEKPAALRLRINGINALPPTADEQEYYRTIKGDSDAKRFDLAYYFALPPKNIVLDDELENETLELPLR